jgi:hypothetical protein
VPSHKFACHTHWFSIPKEIRDDIWAGYREEPLGERHTAAMEAATAFLEDEVEANG